MGYSQISLDISEGIATLTLNRPEKMNAFTGTMMNEIIDAMDRTDADDDVRAVIFTGAGERAFCAGADLTPGSSRVGGGRFFWTRTVVQAVQAVQAMDNQENAG